MSQIDTADIVPITISR